MEFFYYDFNEDPSAAVLKAIKASKNLIVFPTERNKKRAIKYSQEKWGLCFNLYLTMEELKHRLFDSKRPIISSTLRSFVLYSLFNTKQKELFGIEDYFSFLSLGNNIVKFWQEQTEELVKDHSVRDVVGDFGLEANWQLNQMEAIFQLKQGYHTWLQENNYTDIIFMFDIKNINLEWLRYFSNIHFVNQFYYSNLEKLCIKLISKNDTRVSLHFQMPPAWVSEADIAVSGIELSDIDRTKTNLKNIECLVVADKMQQLYHSFELFNSEGFPDTIIDPHFSDSSYPQLLSSDFFKTNIGVNVTQTYLYNFFAGWLKIVTNISDKRVSLLSLYEVASSESFKKYYQLKDDFFYIIEKKLIDGYHYLSVSDIPNKHLLKDYEDLSIINCFQDLTDFVQKRNYTNLTETYFDPLLECLYTTLVELALLDRWNSQLYNFSSPSSFLRLFLFEFGKRKLSNKMLSTANKKRIEINGYLDIRNVAFRSIAVFNATHGILPTSKKTQFLLSESQRKELGLKTYDDVLIREKYYFFRQILVSEKARIFSIQNTEKNQEISSFVEELHFFLPNMPIIIKPNRSNIYSEDFFKFYKSSSVFHPDRSGGIASSVGMKLSSNKNLPLTITDFPNNEIFFSYSSFTNINECPFKYFVQNIIRLKMFPQEIKAEIKANVLGTIIHEIFMKTNLVVLQMSDSKQIKNKISEEIDRCFKKYRNSIPVNFHKAFLEKFLYPLLKEHIFYFYDDLLNKRVDRKTIKSYISEAEDAADEVKLFGDITLKTGEKIFVYMKARADLRLELLDNKAIIVDYKTGQTADAKQLTFYEWFYYGLGAKESKIEMQDSFFYYVFDKRFEIAKKSNITKDEVLEVFKNVINNRYYCKATKKSACRYCDYQRLCRR